MRAIVLAILFRFLHLENNCIYDAQKRVSSNYPRLGIAHLERVIRHRCVQKAAILLSTFTHVCPHDVLAINYSNPAEPVAYALRSIHG
jgi:hypothetical protein